MDSDLVKKELPRALLASLASRLQRNLPGNALIDVPPPGTPLLVSLAVAFEHSGIYLGGGHVAELHGTGSVKMVTLTEFLNGQPGDPLNIRFGTRIFAACSSPRGRPLDSATALELARRALAANEVPGYDFAERNCHLFTAACVCGESVALASSHRRLTRRIVSIDCLERILAERLNGGRPIAWRGVRRSADFPYTLPPAKERRLGGRRES